MANENPTDLVRLAQDIAKELGDGWTFKPLDEPYPTQYITGPNEAELAIRIETYGSRKGRIEVHGNFHIGRNREFIDVRDWNHTTSERCKLPEISVSGNRGAEAIAKEIKRRFLPEYLPLLQKAIDKRDAANSHEDKTRANLVILLQSSTPEYQKSGTEAQRRSTTMIKRMETFKSLAILSR